MLINYVVGKKLKEIYLELREIPLKHQCSWLNFSLPKTTRGGVHFKANKAVSRSAEKRRKNAECLVGARGL